MRHLLALLLFAIPAISLAANQGNSNPGSNVWDQIAALRAYDESSAEGSWPSCA